MADRQVPGIRRIVTGHDDGGAPVVWIDGLASNHKFPRRARLIDPDVVYRRPAHALFR